MIIRRLTLDAGPVLDSDSIAVDLSAGGSCLDESTKRSFSLPRLKSRAETDLESGPCSNEPGFGILCQTYWLAQTGFLSGT